VINLSSYLVTYDKLFNRSVENLEESEIKFINAYLVRKSVEKEITADINIIKEWELEWNDFEFQKKQYYEYATIIHLTKNPELLDGVTHVGLFHYDVVFNRNSINDVISSLNSNPNQIFYQSMRGIRDLYLSRYECYSLCQFLSEKLNMNIDINKVELGWVSEAMSIVPIDIFRKFGQFLFDNSSEIEDILINNRWGIMDRVNHRICGLVERMWGIYLVCCDMPLNKMNVEHDWDFYQHSHLEDTNWINKSNIDLDSRQIFDKIISTSEGILNSLDTSYVNNYPELLAFGKRDNNPNIDYYHYPPSREHYRLLIYISTLFNNQILFDIGTNRCMSAMALSYNKNNKIKSYDIIQQLPENPKVDNIDFILGDSTDDIDIKNTPFIFLDVDHDGVYENVIYEYLHKINWKGILLLDDIHLNEPMSKFWQNISEEKYDITNIGHWSGTGIILFK